MPHHNSFTSAFPCIPVNLRLSVTSIPQHRRKCNPFSLLCLIFNQLFTQLHILFSKRTPYASKDVPFIKFSANVQKNLLTLYKECGILRNNRECCVQLTALCFFLSFEFLNHCLRRLRLHRPAGKRMEN